MCKHRVLISPSICENKPILFAGRKSNIFGKKFSSHLKNELKCAQRAPLMWNWLFQGITFFFRLRSFTFPFPSCPTQIRFPYKHAGACALPSTAASKMNIYVFWFGQIYLCTIEKCIFNVDKYFFLFGQIYFWFDFKKYILNLKNTFLNLDKYI